eukprot:SAG22_NODE_2202_length_2843_cov_2.716108_2_plen_136_part_00
MMQTTILQSSLRNTLVLEPNASRSFNIAPFGIGSGVKTLTGYSVDELSGQTMNTLYGKHTSKTDRGILERALQEHEPLSCDILCYTKDQQPWWRHMLAIPTAGGGFVTFNMNITQADRCATTIAANHIVGRYPAD